MLDRSSLPDEILLTITDPLSAHETAPLAAVNWQLNGLFKPEIAKKKAREAAEYAIYPTKENVEKLKARLKACPELLLHQVTVKNRHGMAIKGTIYQIALHEGDDALIDDEIKSAFNALHDGEKTMAAQHKAQFPDGWMEAEEKACASALTAIDNIFTAFKNASDPNDVTELRTHPYTITINDKNVNEALDAFRKAIDALYKPREKVIKSGRDVSIRILARVIARYIENYNALGGNNTPRNNALIRSVFGYGQRSAPINFMQAFAQGVYYIVELKEKLKRSFEYRHRNGEFILPLDSDPHFRLGYEHYGGGAWGRVAAGSVLEFSKLFSIKNNTALRSVMQRPIQDADPLNSVERILPRKSRCTMM